MSGGKGGSQTTQVEIPQWLENAAQANLAQGRDVSRIGYTPYYGPDVAGLTPTQMAARSNINQAAQAFGMQGIQDSALGAPTTYAGGVQGYSSGSLYDQAVNELAARRPGQYAAIQKNFIDPYGTTPQATQYVDPYQSYFQTPSYNTSNMAGIQNATDAEIYANAASGNVGNIAPANIAYNGQVYNLNDPAQAEAYKLAFQAGQDNNVDNNQANNQPDNVDDTPAAPTAAEAIAGLKAGSGWSTLSKAEKIAAAVKLANEQGYTAEDLAPVLGLPADTIRGYL